MLRLPLLLFLVAVAGWAQEQKAGQAFDFDHEFDGGSKVALTALSQVQTDNLVTLGKVWGFLKYHHPKVMAGKLHWDYELFRVLPDILAAQDRAAANARMLRWVDDLGEVSLPGAPATLREEEIHLRPETGWREDVASLGAELSGRLRAIHAGRAAQPEQFYVQLRPNVGNPVFARESGHAQIKLPDAGFQLLALYRYWNIIRYWFPYRDLIGEDWDRVLVEYVPRVALAPAGDDYKREMLTLIARVHDTHANLWSSLKARPPGGDCQVSVGVRFVEGRALVTRVLDEEGVPPSGLRLGDIIERIDGVPVAQLVEKWTPYYAASNDPTRLRDIARTLTQGPAGEARLTVQRDSEIMEIASPRVPIASVEKLLSRTHDRPGATFKLLSKDVAYLKLSTVKQEEASSYIERAAGTKGLVIDIRNYPSAFMVFALGALLVDQPTEFARFTKGDLANPGAFHSPGR